MRLLDIITEKYTRDNQALQKYLNAAEVDIFQFWPRFGREWGENSEEFIEWVESTNNMGMDYMFDEYEPPYNMPPELVAQFQEYIKEEAIPDLMQNDPTEAPTWAYLDPNKKQLLNRQTWLLHFSDNADDIAREGFTIGMDQMDRLGLTTYFSNDGDDKSYGGYNFAFKANDPRGYNGGEKYGAHLVMFQNSGVEAWHNGDEENQVMFTGSDVDPRGIIYIENDGGDWAVKPHPLSKYQSPRDDEVIVRFEQLEQVVKWVIQNVDQYRKAITGY